MAIRDDVLPILDEVRGYVLDDIAGFRLHSVTLRTVTWSGLRVGDGTSTTVDTPLTLDGVGHKAKVAALTNHEVIAGGGKYEDGDYRVGPFTPTYPGGGRDPFFFNPPSDGIPREVRVRLVGPGIDAWCRIIDTDTDGSLRYMLTIRRNNTV
jgi:hypothetical protein